MNWPRSPRGRQIGNIDANDKHGRTKPQCKQPPARSAQPPHRRAIHEPIRGQRRRRQRGRGWLDPPRWQQAGRYIIESGLQQKTIGGVSLLRMYHPDMTQPDLSPMVPIGPDDVCIYLSPLADRCGAADVRIYNPCRTFHRVNSPVVLVWQLRNGRRFTRPAHTHDAPNHQPHR